MVLECLPNMPVPAGHPLELSKCTFTHGDGVATICAAPSLSTNRGSEDLFDFISTSFHKASTARLRPAYFPNDEGCSLLVGGAEQQQQGGGDSSRFWRLIPVAAVLC